jgi:ABC-type multidrug transport system ATPase subunit
VGNSASFFLSYTATSALDTATERSVQDALTALGKSRTVLIIAHRLSTVRHANEIIVMDGGRVAERGSHDELLKLEGQGGIYAKLWNMQLKSREGVLGEADSGGGDDDSKATGSERKDTDVEIDVLSSDKTHSSMTRGANGSLSLSPASSVRKNASSAP